MYAFFCTGYACMSMCGGARWCMALYAWLCMDMYGYVGLYMAVSNSWKARWLRLLEEYIGHSLQLSSCNCRDTKRRTQDNRNEIQCTCKAQGRLVSTRPAQLWHTDSRRKVSGLSAQDSGLKTQEPWPPWLKTQGLLKVQDSRLKTQDTRPKNQDARLRSQDETLRVTLKMQGTLDTQRASHRARCARPKASKLKSRASRLKAETWSLKV